MEPHIVVQIGNQRYASRLTLGCVPTLVSVSEISTGFRSGQPIATSDLTLEIEDFQDHSEIYQTPAQVYLYNGDSEVAMIASGVVSSPYSRQSNITTLSVYEKPPKELEKTPLIFGSAVRVPAILFELDEDDKVRILDPLDVPKRGSGLPKTLRVNQLGRFIENRIYRFYVGTVWCEGYFWNDGTQPKVTITNDNMPEYGKLAVADRDNTDEDAENPAAFWLDSDDIFLVNRYVKLPGWKYGLVIEQIGRKCILERDYEGEPIEQKFYATPFGQPDFRRPVENFTYTVNVPDNTRTEQFLFEPAPTVTHLKYNFIYGRFRGAPNNRYVDYFIKETTADRKILEVRAFPIKKWVHPTARRNVKFTWKVDIGTEITDSLSSEKYIFNHLPSEDVHEVVVPSTKNDKSFANLPQTFFTLELNGGLPAPSYLTLRRRPGDYTCASLTNEIHVTATSSVSGNPAELAKYIIENYLDGQVNTTSYNAAKNATVNAPLGFALLEPIDPLTLLGDISYQGLLGLHKIGTYWWMVPLNQRPESVRNITRSNVLEYSVEYTESESLYQRVDLTYNRDYLFRQGTQITLGKNHPILESDFYLHNSKILAIRAARFWLARSTFPLPTYTILMPIEFADMEPLQGVQLQIDGLDVRGQIISKSIKNFTTVEYRVWTPVRIGTKTELLRLWSAENPSPFNILAGLELTDYRLCKENNLEFDEPDPY